MKSAIANILQAQGEVKALNTFFTLMATEPARAFYGLKHGANVLIFSSMHPSGEQLSLLSGVAAILRFPLHELEDEAMSDSEEEDNADRTNDTK
uniref:ERF1 domain-containing protein n=1 Tax=Parascaris equorum TaxID=6256 RepID=A0A914RMF5_PAREQ